MKRVVAAISTVSIVLAVVISGATAPVVEKELSHTEWVAKSLQEIEAIKVGSTHEQFWKVFTGDGGISYGRYVYRGCPYIKVDAEFKNMKLTKISKPYLQRRIED